MDDLLSYQNYELIFEDNFDNPTLEIGRASCRERVEAIV